MHRPSLIALALAAALVPAAPAGAKQAVAVSVCGANGCADRTAIMGRQQTDGGLLDLGTVRVAEPQAEPFVRLKVHIGDGSGQAFGLTTVLLLPKSGLAATEDGSWWQVPPARLRELRRLVRGVPRLPAAKLGFPAAADRAGPAEAARVDEVVAPPPPAAPKAIDGGGASTTAIAGGGVAALLALGGGAAVVARRRRHGPTALGETPAAG